jgi:cytochrome c553
MRITKGNRRDPSRASRWPRPTVLVAGTAVLLSAGSGGRADAPDVAGLAHVESIAVTVCGSCHGRDGNSTQPKFPRLAGQQAPYLAAQLKAFRAQTRGDPDAIGYMWGMASQLDDTTIDALASHYAEQKAAPSKGRDLALMARGREIYAHGIESQGVPACSSCHGPDAHGLQDFPRLGAQHAQYIVNQLASFQSNMRNVPVMHGVAQNLRLVDMQAVAAYLEAQP